MGFNQIYGLIYDGVGGTSGGGGGTTTSPWTSTQVNTVLSQLNALNLVKPDNKIATNSLGEIVLNSNQEASLKSK